jgi:hypothetical protein
MDRQKQERWLGRFDCAFARALHPDEQSPSEGGKGTEAPPGDFNASFQPANATSKSDLGLRPRL